MIFCINCRWSNMTEPSGYLRSSFQVFLPKEYREEFSREWLMGLSPFYDQTCAQCFTVQQGKRIGLGPQEFDEASLRCEARL